jgi:hypothetical protein
MTPLILNWPQAFAAGLLTCGGKGYRLATLHRYGFPVPIGGVVVAEVYRQFMQAPALLRICSKRCSARLRASARLDCWRDYWPAAGRSPAPSRGIASPTWYARLNVIQRR